jgi:Cys-tRNA synthase (O-phospho-L-seryl-tRNA:Cys-tRNA synthase)
MEFLYILMAHLKEVIFKVEKWKEMVSLSRQRAILNMKEIGVMINQMGEECRHILMVQNMKGIL